jgi:general secretion pathway protein G
MIPRIGTAAFDKRRGALDTTLVVVIMMTTSRQGRLLKHRSSIAGSGLLEILIVVAILFIMFWLFTGKLGGGGPIGDGQKMVARGDIEVFGAALDSFEKDCGTYPSTEQGLQVLILRPPNCPNWKGPYLKATRIKDDPWGSKYIYKCPGVKTSSNFDLCSPGPDKIEGTHDDICNLF